MSEEKTNKIYQDVQPGAKVRVSLKIKDIGKKGEEKTRIQVFEGMVIGRKHGNETGATITVRKISEGVGVEKIIPLHSPVVAGIEVIAKYRVKQSKLGYLRNPRFKKKLKEIKEVDEKAQKSTPKNKIKKSAEDQAEKPDESAKISA